MEESELNTELWGLIQTAARNWLLAAPLNRLKGTDKQATESPDSEFVPVFNRDGGIDLYDIYVHGRVSGFGSALDEHSSNATKHLELSAHVKQIN